MLLRFGVANFHSIRDYAEVSLIASKAIKDKGPALLEGPGKLSVLPALLLYGANASGKSAVFNILGMMKRNVRNSFTTRKPEEKIERMPFALDPRCADEPTHADCDFVIDGVRYHYGFEYNESVYLKEWLYSYPESYRRVLFYRDGPDQIEFGPTLKGRNKVIADLNRPNSLFLSAAAQNGHPQLTPVYSWFSQLRGVAPNVNNDRLQRQMSGDMDERLIPFLRHADTGIIGATIRSESPSENAKALFSSIKEAMKEHVPEDALPDAPGESTAVMLSHLGKDGAHVDLPFILESRGTRRLIGLLIQSFKALDEGGVLFVDELDASMHTLLSMKLLELFSDSAINTKGAQLVATTHDTNILCASDVRRDQIWFVEKDVDGATSVYPLTDVRTRNTDNLEKGYLQGRFGGVPFLGSVRELLANPEHA